MVAIKFIFFFVLFAHALSAFCSDCYIVKFKKKAQEIELRNILGSGLRDGLQIDRKSSHAPRIYTIRGPESFLPENEKKFLEEIRKNPLVEYAQRDHKLTPSRFSWKAPRPPLLPSQGAIKA
ncbi:MAG: hypothetical protein OXB88_06940 [Bacteriovoracales bacterium]|nr:hypothetical protein [Bacteriovoracales bacterium]